MPIARPAVCRAGTVAVLAAVVLIIGPPLSAQPQTAPVWPTVIRDWLVVPLGPANSRFVCNPVIERYVLDPAAPAPRTGDSTNIGGGAAVWHELAADDEGNVRAPALRHGLACGMLISPADGTVLLEPEGALAVHVNGVSACGDFYNRGRTLVPVPVHEGANAVYVEAIRGGFRLRVHRAPDAPALLARDATLPDARDGEMLDAHGALLVVNPLDEPADGLSLVAGDDSGPFARTITAVAPVAPVATFKAPFRIRLREPLEREAAGDTLALPVRLMRGGRELARHDLTIRLRALHQRYRATFRSGIDGSVQYYAVVPPRNAQPGHRYGLVLTLHGAAVTAEGQAACFAPKEWAYVVAPTNRRPFGFDWEDWGRRDAMEALDHALATLPIDPDHVCLTGHSMGGHGAWHIGVTHPDRFAAVGPSAGWISLFGYGRRPGAGSHPAGPLLVRATGPSHTLDLLENLRDLPVYVLHGERDDNVPASEAERMREALGAFHRRFHVHIQPGAGHWWGNDCVDWLPMMDVFQRSRRPVAPRRIAFATASPGVSARCHWLTVAGQTTPFALSKVTGEIDPRPDAPLLTITTENVDRLAVDLARFGRTGAIHVQATIDGDALAAEADSPLLRFARDVAGTWQTEDDFPAGERSPTRYGPFKAAFDRRFALVYGTRGTPDETAAALRKARFDAHVWWYRGNGAARVLPDTAPDAELADCNVILYGNADTNAAFARVLGDDPVLAVKRDGVRLGGDALPGESLSVLAFRPRPGTTDLAVGVVGATDVAAMRRLLSIHPFRSGEVWPDVMVLTMHHSRPDPVVAAGFFARDWSADVAGGAEIYRKE